MPSTSATTEAKEASTMRQTIVRTYQTFEIRWDRGSRWTGFDSAGEAQAVIDGSSEAGTVHRVLHEARMSPTLAHISRRDGSPAIAERVELEEAAG